MRGREAVLFPCHECLIPEWTVGLLLMSPVVLVNNYRPSVAISCYFFFYCLCKVWFHPSHKPPGTAYLVFKSAEVYHAFGWKK